MCGLEGVSYETIPVLHDDPDSLHKRLDLYALAASTAGVSFLALGGQSAEAEIIYTPTNQTIGVNSSFNLDLNHDGITDFQLWNKYSFRNAIEAKLGIKPMAAANRIAGNSEFTAALPGGVPIGGSARFPSRATGSWCGGSIVFPVLSVVDLTGVAECEEPLSGAEVLGERGNALWVGAFERRLPGSAHYRDTNGLRI